MKNDTKVPKGRQYLKSEVQTLSREGNTEKGMLSISYYCELSRALCKGNRTLSL